MRFLSIILVIASISFVKSDVSTAAEPSTIDQAASEPIRQAIADLESPDFQKREAATDTLSKQGLEAIPSLIEAAENRATEASVRVFSILQRMYFEADEPINDAVELAFQRLKSSENLDVAARAVRVLDNNAETRQKRAIPKFEKLGGMIQFVEPDFERQAVGRAPILFVAILRGWTGGNEGLKILTRIDELRQHATQMYVIRGVDVSEEALLDLAAELPFLDIKQRGPAKLGIRSRNPGKGSPVLIDKVDPDSAAERAGLRAGDRVLKIDGEEVDSFDRLIEVIGEREPGDRVPIVFLREDQVQTAEAVLAPWSSKEAAK